MAIECISFEQAVTDLLKSKQFSNIEKLLYEEQNQALIKDKTLDLVSEICLTIKQNNDILLDPNGIVSCTNILTILIDKGNPKEILIALLEAIDSFKEDECFEFLLIPLQKVLLRLPNKRAQSLEWVLDTLNGHFFTIPIINDKCLEDEELLLLDLNPDVQRTAKALSVYIGFLKPFVEEVSLKHASNVIDSDRVISQRSTLQKCILGLLDRPLMYQDLHILPGKSLSSIQSSCQKLLHYLGQITQNFFVLYNFKNQNDSHDDNMRNGEFISDYVSHFALGNLAYLMFVENLMPDNRLYIYRPSFLFQIHMPYVVAMISRTEHLVLYKGLHLAKFLLDHVLNFELPVADLQLNEFIKLFKALSNVAVYCQVENHRYLSASLMLNLMTKFHWKARYDLLLSLVNQIDHTAVQGLVIDAYRNFLHDCVKDPMYAKYFIGKNLHTFMKQAICLKKGVETDILENYNNVLSALSMIRYLVIIDSKDINFTGVYTVIDWLKKNFLEPLQLGIDITRAHYTLETKKIKEKKQSKKSELNMSVTVDNQVLPNLPPACEEQLMSKGLVSLDLIQSVLSRVNELLDKKNC